MIKTRPAIIRVGDFFIYAVMAVAMFITGAISSRIELKGTLLCLISYHCIIFRTRQTFQWYLGTGCFAWRLTWRDVLERAFPWCGNTYGNRLYRINYSYAKSRRNETAKPKTSLKNPFRALKHRSLLVFGVAAASYNYGFFTLLAFAPFILGLDEHGLGFAFLGWDS